MKFNFTIFLFFLLLLGLLIASCGVPEIKEEETITKGMHEVLFRSVISNEDVIGGMTEEIRRFVDEFKEIRNSLLSSSSLTESVYYKFYK